MDTRRIGSLEVSIVGLGCNNFGRRLDSGATSAVVDAALDAGINFFDTADVYGGTKSEEYLGRALGRRRDEVVVATKFGSAVDEQRKGARPEYVRQAAEDSLRRLDTDRIDLYQLHTPDPQVPIEETLGALDELVWAGKVREIGCSNFSAEQLRAAEGATRDGAVRERTERVQPSAPRARARRSSRMRPRRDRFHILLPAGQWPAHGEVPPRTFRPRRKPPPISEGR
jgi:aryl-alcohol dehydrogenase-like predicted oxidoreductase